MIPRSFIQEDIQALPYRSGLNISDTLMFRIANRVRPDLPGNLVLFLAQRENSQDLFIAMLPDVALETGFGQLIRRALIIDIQDPLP